MLRTLLLLVCVCCVLCSSSFQQLQCIDSNCIMCDLWKFPADTCLLTSGRNTWGMGSCTVLGFRQRVWYRSECIGTPDEDTILELNTCLKSDNGGYLEEICGATTRLLDVDARDGHASNQTMMVQRPL